MASTMSEQADSMAYDADSHTNDVEDTGGLDKAGSPEADDTIAMMSFHQPNYIRLLCFPGSMLDFVREVINTIGDSALQAERDQARTLEFQVKGLRWSDNILGARLVCRLLEVVYRHGWRLSTTTALSENVVNIDQMFFDYNPEGLPTMNFMTIAFDSTNRVYFIDAPGDVLAVMVASLGSEKQTHGPTKLKGCYEFKLRGTPWRGRPQDHTAASLRAMTILQTLKRNGWQVYSNFGSRILQRDKYCVRRSDAWISCRSAAWDPSTSPDFQ